MSDQTSQNTDLLFARNVDRSEEEIRQRYRNFVKTLTQTQKNFIKNHGVNFVDPSQPNFIDLYDLYWQLVLAGLADIIKQVSHNPETQQRIQNYVLDAIAQEDEQNALQALAQEISAPYTKRNVPVTQTIHSILGL